MVLKSYKDFIVGKGLLRTPLLKYNIFRRVQKSQSMHTSECDNYLGQAIKQGQPLRSFLLKLLNFVHYYMYSSCLFIFHYCRVMHCMNIPKLVHSAINRYLGF